MECSHFVFVFMDIPYVDFSSLRIKFTGIGVFSVLVYVFQHMFGVPFQLEGMEYVFFVWASIFELVLSVGATFLIVCMPDLDVGQHRFSFVDNFYGATHDMSDRHFLRIYPA